MIDHTYYVRDKSIQRFYSKLKKFYNDYVDCLSSKISNGQDNNTAFEVFYGQEQFHLKTNETLLDQLTKRFYDKNNGENMSGQNNLNKSHPIYEIFNNNKFESTCNSLPSSPKSENHKPFLVRDCDELCIMPIEWGQRIYDALGYFRPSLNFKKCQFNICEFEKCEACYNKLDSCDLGTSCTDNFKFISDLSRHYQGLRTMIR